MTDLCQTPGCGHARYDHFRTTSRCGESSCPCTGYTAPTETVSEDERKHEAGMCSDLCLYCHGYQPTREQVLADEQAAWDAWAPEHLRFTEMTARDGFKAGYLAGKGIAE